MKTVRLGIIGMGNMGKFHADYLLAGKVKRAELTAVCSTSPAKLEKYKALKIFDDAGQLIRSGAVDAVVIATPHPQHPAQAIAAFEAALSGRGMTRSDLTASRTRIRDLLRTAELAARRLDLIIGNRPDTEAAVQVVWKQARRIERGRKRPRRDTLSTEIIGRRNLLGEGVVAVVPSLPHRPLAALPAAVTPSP